MGRAPQVSAALWCLGHGAYLRFINRSGFNMERFAIMPRAPLVSWLGRWRPVFIDADLIPVSRTAPELRFKWQRPPAVSRREDSATRSLCMALRAFELRANRQLCTDAQPEGSINFAFDFEKDNLAVTPLEQLDSHLIESLLHALDLRSKLWLSAQASSEVYWPLSRGGFSYALTRVCHRVFAYPLRDI